MFCFVDTIDHEIVNALKEFRALESRRGNNYDGRVPQVALNVGVVAPRVALSLLEESSRNVPAETDQSFQLPVATGAAGPGLSSANSTYVPMLTMVFYGLYGSFQRGHISHEGYINCRVGSIRAYGCKGVEVLSCGQDTDYWLHNFNIESTGTRKIALSCNIQWSMIDNEYAEMDDEGDDSNADDNNSQGSASKSKRPDNNSNIFRERFKKHVVLEVFSSNIYMQWDEKTIIYMTELFLDHIHYPSGISSSLETMSSKSDHDKLIFGDVKQKCARVSLYKASLLKSSSVEDLVNSGKWTRAKWSIDFTVKDVTLDIPFKSNEASIAYTKARFSLGLLQLQGGDYFVNSQGMHANNGQFTEDSLSEIPSRHLWSHVDKILKLKLQRIHSPVIHNVVLTFQAMELGLMNDDPSTTTNSTKPSILTLTSVPWGVKGLISICAIPGHAIHPRIQLDMYSSPFRVSCTPKVTLLY